MAYADLAKAWVGQNPALLDQIAGACLSCAVDILNEDAGAANHANRLIWAEKVKHNLLVEATRFLVHVCENATIAAALPNAVDSDVKYVVASNLNTYATGS
jgi:hypothetical protein